MQNKTIFNRLISTSFKAIFFFLSVFLVFSFDLVHPYYVSNTDINYNSTTNSLEITCRIFTDNLEDALEKSTKKSINILQPKNKEEINQCIYEYITQHLQIKTNGEKKVLNFIGYEQNEDAIWIYLEAKENKAPTKIDVLNTILYDFLPQQMNMIHFSVNGDKKISHKLNNPDSKFSFNP
jgi:hypothetical protein